MLILACVGGGLTIYYPPSWTGSAMRWPPLSDAASPAGPVPHEPAPGQAAGPVFAGRTLPRLGALYARRLPLGDQSVPLPPGDWQVLASAGPAAAGDGPASMSVFLAMVLGGRLAGAAVISGSIAPDPKAAGFAAPLELQSPGFYYRRVFASVDHGPLDVWVTGVTHPARWPDPLRKAAAGVLRKQGLAVPEQLESAVFRLADKTNWLSAEFMFPATTPDEVPVRPWTEVALQPDTAVLSHLEKVRRWGKVWHTVMAAGFAGRAWSPDEARIALP